jgi:hypothetical protein
MKAQILKIAGVKSEKEFYKKYPSEEAFMKVHGKAFKKAQIGAYIGGDTIANPKMINFNAMYDEADLAATGMTNAMRKEQAEKAAEAAAKDSEGGAGGGMGGMDLNGIMSMIGGGGEGGDTGGIAEIASMAGGRDGLHIPKAASGTNMNDWWSGMTTDTTTTVKPAFDINKWGIGAQTMGKLGEQPAPSNKAAGDPVDTSKENWMFKNTNTIPQVGAPSTQGVGVVPNDDEAEDITLGGVTKMLGPVGSVIEGIGALRAERTAAQQAKRSRMLSELQLKASTTRPEERERKYVRPEDVVNTGEEFFPIYGVGTNVLAKDGRFIKRAQNGIENRPGGMMGREPMLPEAVYEVPEVSEIPAIPGATDWYEEGMDKDTYYGFKKQLDDAGYTPIARPETVNIEEMNAITEAQPDPNQMSDEEAAAFMETYNRDRGVSTGTFDSKSARDVWVHKTGLPWSEAKKLGYTTGTAKDNIKLLSELNDPRFKKENLRTAPPKKSSQSRTPVQHRDTPTGKLAPIKKAMTLQEFYKSKGWNTSKKYKGPEIKQDTRSSYQRELDAKRSQAEYDDYLLGELPLYYLANPSKAIGDLRALLNPNFTPENETSEPFRKQVMANRYNQSISAKERSARHRQMGYKLVPDAALNTAAVLSGTPYTTFEAMPLGIGQGAAPRAAGYIGQGAARLNQAAPRMLGYQDGGMIGGNPTEIQNTYGSGNSLFDDLGYEPLINYDQQKDYRYGGYIQRAQDGETGWQRWKNSMAGKGSGFSGSMAPDSKGAAAAAAGGGGTPWGAIGSTAGGLGQNIMGGQNAGGNIGGTVGGAVGSIFGPAGGAIGSFVGQIAGNALDPYQRRMKKDNAATKKNVQNIAMNQMAPSIQAGYASHMKDGGWVSNDWQPQVIATFGEHKVKDLLRHPHDADMLRAGGHLREYTPPSARAMETYEDGGEVTSYGMGGQLKTHWGGEAETMSYNPYLPGSGETVVFRGQSHTDSDGKGNTGIGITYGDNPVEVERGEPMFEMQSGGEVNPETGEPENTGVVFGNMQIDKKIAGQIDDPELMEIANKYHGKKFKNVGIDLSKQEAKQNKIIDKSTNELDNLEVNTAFDKLKLSALRANLEGANLKLKGIANTKIALANYQNAINDTKEEMSDAFGQNLSAEDLAKGLIRIDKDPVTKDAKWGGNIVKKAQDGVTTPKKTIVPKKTKEQYEAEGWTLGADGKYYLKKKGVAKPAKETRVGEAMKEVPKGQKKKADGTWGNVTPEQFAKFKEENKDWFDFTNFNPNNKGDVEYFQKRFNEEAAKTGTPTRITVDDALGEQTVTARIKADKKLEPAPDEELVGEVDVPDEITPQKSRFPWEIPANMILDYIRPTDQSELDYNQLMGEMYALSTNQLEPVQAQLYRPELGVPYDISYQDILNENQADFKSTQRMLGYNPAAQAALDAQKYQANQKVLGEQFRANQAMKDQVYTNNRNTLNQAKLANLGILDKQYERQSQAMSNTKATTQSALNSISDKYAKNKLENRKLSIYENMYNYRFGNSGRAKNYNGFQFFDTDIYGAKSRKDQEIPEGYKATSYDANGNPVRLQRITEKDMQEEEAALEAVGGIKGKNGASAKKNYKNSSVVKAYKNL